MSYEELGKQLKKGKSDNKADPATKKGKGADKSGEKNPKRVCLQWLNLSTCEYGEKCKFAHAEETSTHMVDEDEPWANTRWPTGTEVVIINVPKNSDIDGLHARVMGHKNQRLCKD